jgi:hypothetical protein
MLANALAREIQVEISRADRTYLDVRGLLVMLELDTEQSDRRL